MIRLGRRFAGAVGLLWVFSSFAGPTGIDCKVPKTAAETFICTSSQLIALDQELARAYQAYLPKIPRERLPGVQSDQNLWLEDRAKCSTASAPDEGKTLSCMQSLYDQRLRQLGEIGNGCGLTFNLKLAPGFDWKPLPVAGCRGEDIAASHDVLALAHFTDENASLALKGAGLCVRINSMVGPEDCLRRWVDHENQGGPYSSKEKAINGVKFIYEALPGVEARRGSGAEIYRTFHAGTCYQLELYLDTMNINLGAPGEKELVKKTEAKLKSMLSTFKFKFDSKDAKTPAKTEESGKWRTLSSTSLPIAFQYPSDLRIVNERNRSLGLQKGGVYGLDERVSSDLEGTMSVISVSHRDPKDAAEAESALDGEPPIVFSLGGETAYEVKGGQMGSVLIFVRHKSKMYRIQMNQPSPAQLENLIKSFQFVEEKVEEKV